MYGETFLIRSYFGVVCVCLMPLHAMPAIVPG